MVKTFLDCWKKWNEDNKNSGSGMTVPLSIFMKKFLFTVSSGKNKKNIRTRLDLLYRKAITSDFDNQEVRPWLKY